MTNKAGISLKFLRRSHLWTAFVVAALLTHFAFVVHQIEHFVHVDEAATAEECIACQLSSFTVDGPDANAAIPFEIELGSVALVGHDLSLQREQLKKFQSRAPPTSISA